MYFKRCCSSVLTGYFMATHLSVGISSKVLKETKGLKEKENKRLEKKNSKINF